MSILNVVVLGNGGGGPNFGLDAGETITAMLTINQSLSSIKIDSNLLKFQNVPPSGCSENVIGVPVPEPSLVILLGVSFLAVSLVAWHWKA